MKFLAVFTALVAVAASQSTWTLPQLSDAIQNPNTDPALLPHLEHALNEMMDSLFAGQHVEAVTVTIPAVDLSTWTLNELSAALQDPTTDAALVPYLEHALNEMMDALVTGNPIDVMPVVIPAMEITSWTLNELSEALQDPTTNPALVPYLEHALNEMMEALISGQDMEIIAVAIPAGLAPVIVAPVVVEPVVVEPVVVPSPAETPELPAPVAPAAPASPLVQIIVNINQQQAAVPVAPVVVPESVADITPEPVHVVEHAPIVPEPVHVVEQVPIVPTPVVVAPIIPEPVDVVEQIPIIPMPVVVAPIIPEPVHVVEQAPVASVPIGVVVPSAPAA